MKKRLIKILAVYLSIAMLLPSLLMPEIFALASSDSYTAHLMDLYRSSSNMPGMTLTNEREDTTLSGIKGPTLTYSWSDAATTNNSSGYFYASMGAVANNGDEIDGIPFKTDKYVDVNGNILGNIENGEMIDNDGNLRGTYNTNGSFTYDGTGYAAYSNAYKVESTDAVMFYVKLPSQAPQTEILFQVATAGMAVHTDEKGNKTIYPAVEANQWLILSQNVSVYLLQKGYNEWTEAKTVKSTVDTSKGNLVLPAGFEGWVRIPVSNLTTKEGKSLYGYRFNFYPKQLGGRYTDGGVSIGSFMFVEDGDKAHLKASVEEPNETPRTADLTRERPHSTVTMLEVGNATNGESVTNETHFSNGYTYKLSATSSELTFKGSEKLASGGGIMLYYKQPIDQEGKIKLTVGTATAKGNSDVYTLNRGKSEWTKASTDDTGEISLQKGFEGYIFVPIASLSDAAGKSFSKISLSNLTTSACVGTVLLVTSFDETSIELQLSGEKDYINLYESAYYNATVIETQDAVTHTETNKNYYNVSNKVSDSAFSVGVDNGYYYNVSTGSAAEGTTNQEIAKMPAYTAHISKEIASDVRIRTGVKDTSTGSNYTDKWIISKRLAEKANVPFSSHKVNIKFDAFETMENQHVNDGEFVRSAVKDDWFYAPITFTDKLPVTESSALIFYIENTGSYETEAHLHIGADGTSISYYQLQPDVEYSLLKDGTAKWTKHTTKSSGTSNKGNVVIPANFSGWIKLSVKGFEKSDANIKSGSLANMRYFPVKMGGRYGAVNISHFMTVDEGGKDFLTFMDGSDEKSLLINAEDSFYTATVLTKNTSQKENPLVRPKSGGPFKATDATNITTPIGDEWGMHITSSEGVYYSAQPYVYDSSKRSFAAFYTNNTDSDGEKIMIESNNSVLIYVDHPDSKKSIFAAFGIGGGWYCTRTDRKFYRMADNSAHWVEDTAVALNTDNTEKNFGFLEIPAGFKGWIRIPATSVTTLARKEVADAPSEQKQISVLPNAIGGDYGTLKIGGVRVLAENDNRIYITDKGSNTKEPLMQGLDLTIDKPTYNVTVGSFLGDKNFTTTAPAGEIYSTISLKSNYVIDDGKALMFYATQDGTTQSSFALALNNFEWSMQSGAKYAIYDSKTQYWNGSSAGEDGKITLPAGFSGWVRIPLSSLSDKEKKTATTAITVSKINFTPYTLGGAWGNLKLGTFMITNNGSEDVATMRVDKGEEQPITKSKVYTGTTLALNSMYPAGVNARAMSVKEFDHALLSGTSTFTVNAIDIPVEADLTSAIEVSLSAEASIGKDDALLLYVELEGNKDNALILGEELLVKEGGKYFTLCEGNSASWKQNSVSNEGILPIPAGFKGYVRIPADSFKVLPQNFKKFVFGFQYIGGDYNNPSFGTFIVTDNGAYNYNNIYLNGAIAPASLIIPDHLEGYVLQGTASTRDDANGKLSVEELGNTLTSEISTGYAYKAKPTNEPVSLVDKETSPRLTFKVDDIYKSEMENAGGFMFYVSLPEGKSNRVFVQAQGDNYARLSQGSAFWILPEGDGYWTKRVANVYNELPLPEGFKGWVRIDAKNLLTSANVPLAGALSQINLSWRHIGGDWGEPEFGTFIMLKRSAQSGKLSLRGMDDLNIYGTRMPTEYTEEGIAIWESIIAPFDGYADGSAFGAGSATIDAQGLTVEDDDERRKEAEREASSVFDYKVISDIPASADTATSVDGVKGEYLNPFNSRGIEFTSTEEVNLHGNQWPRFTFSHPFTLKDSKGIVVYVNLPKNPKKDTNQLFFQLYSASGKTVTIKYKKTIATLADGTKNWKNVTLESQSINLPSGFEGYVYIPLDALETYKNANKVNRVLNEFDDVYRMVLGFGHFGGSNDDGTIKEDGKAYLGGMWLNMNGVLSHEGAYVDGATDCRNVFTGEKVSEDAVRYDPFEKPAGEGWIFETLPEATDEEPMLMVEDTSGHSATVVWDKYDGADGYRVDIYQITAIGTGSFDEVYFTYLTSYHTTDNSIVIEGLLPNTYYTVYVVATSNGKGLAIYSPLSVYTESEIIGDMLGYKYDPFEYAWFTYDDYETEDGLDWMDTTLSDDDDEETTYLKKVIKRKKKKSNDWVVWLIVGVSVVAVGGATTLIIILAKKKKKKVAEIINTEVGEDNIS